MADRERSLFNLLEIAPSPNSVSPTFYTLFSAKKYSLRRQGEQGEMGEQREGEELNILSPVSCLLVK
jgi:hypothetical protein